LRRKYAKLSIGADVQQQIICTIKIRRAPTRHDNIDFRPIITRTSDILPLSVVTGDKGYDSEDNHVLVREELYAFSVIPARYEHVPIWRTHGKYRKQMKRGGYSKLLYNQRNKDETIISVIKRLFGEHITSRLVRTQNRELSFRCIAYNTHRLTNLTIITWFLQSQSYHIIPVPQHFIDIIYSDTSELFLLHKQDATPPDHLLLLETQLSIYL
jgi:hypothetical protein